MPVHLAHVEDHAGAIAATVRNLRLARRVSLRELAHATGISAAQISNIETGRAGTDLAQVVKFADALGVSPVDLLPPSTVRHYFVNRGSLLLQQTSSVVPLVRERRAEVVPYHNAFWPLAEPYSGKRMEPYFARVEPRDDGDLSLIGSEPQIFAFVLQGEMEFRARTGGGVQVERLGAGDAIFWDSHVSHLSRASGSEPTEVLCVVSAEHGAPRLTTELAHARSYGTHAVYREQESDDVVSAIGRRIGFVRQAHGVSVAELAGTVGLSPRQLAAVESGARPVRMDTLYRLARAFQRPVSSFMPRAPNGSPAYLVCRAGRVVASSALQRSDGSQPGVHYHPLISAPIERTLHPYLVRFPVGGPVRDSCFPGQQLLYILNGEVEFAMDDQGPACERLRPGDSVFFETSCPHRIRGVSRSPFASYAAEGVAVFWSPTGDPGLGAASE